jgi:hypothetical protein
MALKASANARIPRYLRYKAGDTSADDRWDEEIERANEILHNRIIRFHRDELCKGCARFDWLRTHFYTREVRFHNKEDELWGQKVKNDVEIPLAFYPWGSDRDLEKFREDVSWNSFKIIAGARQEAVWLAKNPRFRWRLQTDQVLRCKLCKSLWSAAGAIPGLARLRGQDKEPSYLDIKISGGPVFEHGGSHHCIEVSLC